jgi:hypothetical protein
MGAYTELVDFTFTADETSRTFSGLNITKDDFIKIVVTQVNESGSGIALRLFPNTTASVSDFDTTTNYHSQRLQGDGSSVAASRSNNSILSFVDNSKTNTSISFFKISENGKTNFFTNELVTNDSGLSNIFRYTTSSNLTFNDPITSLTFTAAATDGLGDGSRIQIYRLDAEKVADITTTENATQVDISSLSIGKDNEYLLVADIVANGSADDIALTPNDLTTVSGYNLQAIIGDGSTESAARVNRPNIAFLGNTGERSLSYNHIKLSEIGAYTHQNYELRFLGTSSVRLVNHFVSSTSEAITSITKLNIFSSGTDGIGSGTRFILYKLK